MFIVSFIILIVSLLISAYVVYWIFKNYGFKLAYIVSVIFTVIQAYLKNKGHYFLVSVIIALITSLISTGIEYYIYNKTNSFWGFLGGIILFGLGVAFILFMIGVVLGMTAGSNGILDQY